MGRTRVAQDVRRQLLRQPACLAVVAHHEPRRLAGEPGATVVEEHCLGVATTGPSLRLHLGPPTGRQPRHERFSSGPTERHDALLGPFAVEPHEPGIEIDVRQRQADHLTDPCPCGIEELEQRPVAQRDRPVADNRPEQRRNLGLAQRLGDTFWYFDAIEICGRIIVAHPLLDEEPVQIPDGRKLAGNARWGCATDPPPADEVDQPLRTDRHHVAVVVTEPGAVGAQVAAIRGQRVARSAALGCHPGQVLLHCKRCCVVHYERLVERAPMAPRSKRLATSNRPMIVFAS